jgi:16S rRNA processing protein RimM
MEYLNIGKLGKIFGLDLQLRVHVLTGMEELWDAHIQNNQAIYVGIDGFKIPFFVATFDDGKELVQFKKVDSESLIKEMSGCDIFIEQTEELKQRVVDVDALITLEIFDANTNQLIGIIDRIEEYPAHPMAIIVRDGEEIMIPIVEDWIVEIQEEQRRIVMELPEGLVDLS